MGGYEAHAILSCLPLTWACVLRRRSNCGAHLCCLFLVPEWARSRLGLRERERCHSERDIKLGRGFGQSCLCRLRSSRLGATCLPNSD